MNLVHEWGRVNTGWKGLNQNHTVAVAFHLRQNNSDFAEFKSFVE